MQSQEARRVLSVVDLALAELKVLALVNEDILNAAHQLSEIVGEEVNNALLAHARQVQRSRPAISAEELLVSTSELLRTLQKFAMAQTRLKAVQVEPSKAMLVVMGRVDKLHDLMVRKLNTTVEEENSRNRHYEDVCRREKRAIKEQETLEHMLRLDRRERHNELLIVNNAHEKARLELEETEAAAARKAAGVDQQAAAERSGDAEAYSQQHDELIAEVQQLRAQLAQLRTDSKAAEEALRKRKLKSEQEVEVWIQKYDEDMGAREAEVQEEQTAYNEVNGQLQHYMEQHARLLAERRQHEECVAAAIAEKQAARELHHRRQRAARTIQRRWKAYKALKDAERKKAAAVDKRGKPAKGKK